MVGNTDFSRQGQGIAVQTRQRPLSSFNKSGGTEEGDGNVEDGATSGSADSLKDQKEGVKNILVRKNQGANQNPPLQEPPKTGKAARIV